MAIVAGLVLGPVDLWGQVSTPYPWAHLFNSPAVWAAAAFAYGRWLHHPLRSPLGAAVLLVVGVEAYYLADILVRGASTSNVASPTAMVWCVAGVVAGLVFGLAGTWSVELDGWRAVLGRASLPAVLGAESVYVAGRVVTEPADGRPDDLGAFAVLLAVLAAAILVALVRACDRQVTIRVVAITVVSTVAVGLGVGVAI